MFDPIRRVSAADIAGATVLAVTNIDSPTELNSRAGGTNGALCLVTQNVAGINEWTMYAFDSSSSGGVNSPYVLAASGSGQWIAYAGKYVNSAHLIAGAVTLAKSSGTALTIASTDAASATTAGGYTSTVATGTAPFTATSTTLCPNLNAANLNGTTWTAPGAIGGGTPGSAAFTTISATGVTNISVATAFPLVVTNTTANSATSGPFIKLAEDSGAAMASGDRLGGVLVGGARDASHTINSSSGFSAFATEAWNGTSAGSSLVFHTVANTTTARSDRMTIGNDGSVSIAATAALHTIAATTDATAIGTASLVLSGGLGVAKRICLDGATGKTLRITNPVVNAAVAVTLGSTGPTGSTAGAPQGWMRVDINGTDRYIPFW